MFYNQTFTPCGHDLFHPFPNVFSRGPFILSDTFDMPFHLGNAVFKVALAESERFVDQRLAIEVKEIKDFN